MAQINDAVTEQEVESAFQKISIELQKAQNAEPNVYQMMGVSSLEKHHSSMFGGLLNPKEPHSLNNNVLKLFLRQLIAYTTAQDKKTQPNQNKEIIIKEFGSETNYNSLIDSITDKTNVEVNFEVSTEYVNPKTDKRGRMDIFAVLPEQKTVLVIENKYGTTTHDDQLVTYFEDIPIRDNKKYKQFKKIFVFLSPFGDIPYNIGGDEKYNENYCVFDYTKTQGICKMIGDIIDNINKNKRLTTTRFALKKYVDMCKKEILGEGYKMIDYEEILNKYKNEYEALKRYEESATLSNVRKYCVQQLNVKLENDEKIPTVFSTAELTNYFSNNNEEIDLSKTNLLIQRIGGAKGMVGYEIKMHLLADGKKGFTPAQKKILEKFNKRGIAGSQDCSAMCVKLLDKQYVCYKFEDVKDEIDNNLKRFKDMLSELNNL